MHHRPFRLKPTLNFYQNRKRFWIGLLCGAGIAIVVFCFQLLLLQANTYLARETHNVFIEVPAPQLLWSKCFFAAVAFQVGSSIAFLIWLAKPSASPQSRRFWLFMARNDQANVLPSFFYIYIKLVFVLFLWFLSFKWLDASNTNLPDIVKVFAVILPIVLLLNQWVNIRRYFRVKVYWMGAHLLLLCKVAFSGSLMPMPMEGYLRQLFEEKRPYINLDIQYPDVVCDDFIRDIFRYDRKDGDLYLGFVDGDTSMPIESMRIQPIKKYHHYGKAIRSAHFDRRLPMFAIDSLMMSYRNNEVIQLESNALLLMSYCNNRDSDKLLKPELYFTFNINTCDTTFPSGRVWADYMPIKVLANGNWTLNDEPYTDELLWEMVNVSDERILIVITYEPSTKLQQVLDAYNYLDRLGRPYTWQEYTSSRSTRNELPKRKFYSTIWFLTDNACLE